MRPMVTHGCHRSFKFKNMTAASENTISSCFFYLILMAANFCFARCKFCKCGLFWESSSSKSPPSSRYNISSNLHIATFPKKRYFLRKKDCELSLHSVPSYDNYILPKRSCSALRNLWKVVMLHSPRRL